MSVTIFILTFLQDCFCKNERFSFTSGAYFKRFREYFLSEGKLLHIHLFGSRNKVFDKEDVLQETIIVKVQKTDIKPNMVTITSTNTNKDLIPSDQSQDIHFLFVLETAPCLL